jgi:threonine-phosphate decarboxylase
VSQAFHGGQIERARREFGRDAFIDFSSNLNVFWPGIPAADWSALREEITRYPEPDARTLRRNMARIEGIDPQFLLPTAGATEALYLAARLFAQARVAIIEPAFADYHRAFVAAGCEPARIVLPPSLWNAPAAEWSDRLAAADVIVLGNPNNPTGAFQSREALFDLIDRRWARAKSWIIDEAFIEFVPDHERESLLGALAKRPSVIVLRSLTKIWRIPGLRLGFLATTNPGWMARLEEMQPPWSVNAVAQAWSRTALIPDARAAMFARLSPLPAVRAELAAGLAALGHTVFPSAANFLFVELRDMSAAAIYRALGRRGFLVRPCDSFYGLTPADAHLRFAVRLPAENDQLLDALALETPAAAFS